METLILAGRGRNNRAAGFVYRNEEERIMFCDRCGTRLAQGERFCPSCGKAVATAPMMPAHGRIAGHIRLLGILWLASAAIHLIPGFFLITFLRPGFLLPPDAPPFLGPLLHMIGLFLLGGAVLSLLAGWGLLERQPWARTLALVLACFHLLNVPFGTALGIYTMWVLLPATSEEEYRQIARAA